MASSINFTPDAGWKRFERAMRGSNFQKKLNKHIALATRRNGLLAVKMLRNEIKRGEFKPNAALTADIKGSSKPLVDRGDFFQSFTAKQDGGKSVFSGILQTDENFNIAETLHDGRVIRVTPKMRNMFRVLWWASNGSISPSTLTGRAAELWGRKPGGWFPLKESTQVIVIPGRPFIEQVFSSVELKRKAVENWQTALRNALNEIAREK